MGYVSVQPERAKEIVENFGCSKMLVLGFDLSRKRLSARRLVTLPECKKLIDEAKTIVWISDETCPDPVPSLLLYSVEQFDVLNITMEGYQNNVIPVGAFA